MRKRENFDYLPYGKASDLFFSSGLKRKPWKNLTRVPLTPSVEDLHPVGSLARLRRGRAAECTKTDSSQTQDESKCLHFPSFSPICRRLSALWAGGRRRCTGRWLLRLLLPIWIYTIPQKKLIWRRCAAIILDDLLGAGAPLIYLMIYLAQVRR